MLIKTCTIPKLAKASLSVMVLSVSYLNSRNGDNGREATRNGDSYRERVARYVLLGESLVPHSQRLASLLRSWSCILYALNSWAFSVLGCSMYFEEYGAIVERIEKALNVLCLSVEFPEDEGVYGQQGRPPPLALTCSARLL